MNETALIRLVIKYYECEFCKKRHWQGRKVYKEHLALRNAEFGVKTLTYYQTIRRVL